MVVALATRTPETDELAVTPDRGATYTPTAADDDVTVALSRARGIDPLSVLLLEFWESGFDPGVTNASTGDGGLNQMDAANLKAAGFTLPQWAAMSIATQQPHVFAFWDSLAKSFAGGAFPQDGAHLYALNFLPARYQSVHAATNPAAALTTKGESYYDQNSNLDPAGTGAISVNTIAARLALVQQQGGPRLASLTKGITDAVARAGTAAPSPVATAAAAASSGGGLLALFLLGGLAFLALRSNR